MKKTILLPEIELDPRVKRAQETFRDSDSVRVLSPSDVAETKNLGDLLISTLRSKKKFKDSTQEECIKIIENSPLVKAALLLDLEYADGLVAGAHYTTADVLRAGIHIIGMSEGSSTASSSFLMTMSDGRKFIFSDCAVIAHPTPIQLAEIAIASVNTAATHHIDEPSVAFLSFSTLGSAADETIETIQEAMNLLKDHPSYNGFPFAGEVQFDTAIIPQVAQKKAPDSPLVNKPANVLIFPDLNSANITYKAVERLAGAKATGPFLQGFKKPINDLSRGCSVSDIIEMINATAQ